jgi:hypothetical protein
MAAWAVTLTVGVDEGRCLFTPRVRVEGRTSFAGGTIRVELVDKRGAVSRVVRRALRARSLGRELRMPSFTAPHGVGADEALRRPWDIVVESDGSEIVHWRRYLEVAASLNDEGEIELAGPRDGLRSKEEMEGRGQEAPWDERDSERLLAALVAEGLLTAAEREEVLGSPATTDGTFERTLIESGRVDEHSLLRVYAEVTGTEFLSLADYPIDAEAADAIPEDLVRRYGMIGIGFRDELLIVAMSDPQDGRAGLAVEMAACRGIYIVVATRNDVFAALEATRARFPG